MNWFFYIGGGFMWVGWITTVWNLNKDTQTSVFYVRLASALSVWIWICWKLA